MTVVTGGGTEKFNLFLLAPGSVSETVGIALGNAVKHNIKGRVSAQNDIVGVNAKHIGKHLTNLGQTVDTAVVAAIDAAVFAVCNIVDAVAKTG